MGEAEEKAAAATTPAEKEVAKKEKKKKVEKATTPQEKADAQAEVKKAEADVAVVSKKEKEVKKEDLGVHPKVATKLNEMSKKIKSDPELQKKAEAAYAKYKKNPTEALKGVKPEVHAKAQQAWQKLHKDAGVTANPAK